MKPWRLPLRGTLADDWCTPTWHRTRAATAPLQTSRRFQSFVGEQRSVARVSKSAYRHPLAPKDPAQRNVTVPTTASRAAAAAATSSSPTANRSSSLSAAELKRQAQKALLLHMQQEALWEGTVVDDVNHTLVQHFVKLSTNDKYRHARRMLVVGGRAMIEELCQAGHRPRHLIVEAGKPIPEWAQGRRDTDVVVVDRHVADAVAPGTDGYAGDFSIPTPPMKEQLIANHQRLNRVLVLDNVDDPGVLGTLLRTAAGYQYDAIITTNHCADLYDHRVLRAARGAHFQTAVPIYTLKEEDGDDVYGLLSHVVERNNLLPLCYTAQPDAAVGDEPSIESAQPGTSTAASGSRVFRSSVVGAAPVLLPPPRQSDSTYGSGQASRHRQEALSDFCLDRFARGSSATDDAQGGYVLFAGPNHKRNLARRLVQRVARPTTQLLLDNLPADGPADLLLSMSIVLHALRPRGNWDYLPVDARTLPSSVELQAKQASVDIGVNRLRMSAADINQDEDEQREAAHLANEFMQWRRRSRRRGTDYDHWMTAEEQRVQVMLKQEHRLRAEPWKTTTRPATTRPMPAWVPNIIDEYRQSLDRDTLVHEREVSSNFKRPPPR